jgi:hypothetical protein
VVSVADKGLGARRGRVLALVDEDCGTGDHNRSENAKSRMTSSVQPPAK